MNLNNLFIFSSKSSKKQGIRDFLKTCFWLIISLVFFDLGINFIFPYPSDPLAKAGKFDRYFNEGRSIEGKILQQIGSTDKSSAFSARMGWLDAENWRENNKNKPIKPDSGDDLLVASYGMSFSKDVSKAMETIDPKLTLRIIGGPAAPPNHSFAAYNLDRGQHDADVVILGILASTVKGLGSLSSITCGVSSSPYTFPKYFVEDGELKAIWPKIQSFAQLRAALQDEEKWEVFTSQLRDYDQFANSFLVRQNILDYSAIVRLIRKTYRSKLAHQIHSVNGFNEEAEQIKVLQEIVKKFAATAHRDGKIPIVLLFNDQGYDDHLFQALKQTLQESSIPFVSTHTIVPANNANNFIGGDGHFTKSANQLIANQVLELIEQHYKQKEQS